MTTSRALAQRDHRRVETLARERRDAAARQVREIVGRRGTPPALVLRLAAPLAGRIPDRVHARVYLGLLALVMVSMMFK